jgi:hypothetical protein
MLIEEDNQQFIVENATLKIIEDTFPVEVDIIERSFTEGAIAPGEQRGTAKNLSLNIDINKTDEQIYRQAVNLLFSRKIRDRINNIETDIRLIEDTISYDEGGQFFGSRISFTLVQLIPYWRDVDFIEISETSTLSNQIIVDNDGFFETPASFIVTTERNLQKFLIKVEENNLGIGLNDFAFGTVNLETYVIDNENGEALLGGILRNNRIIPGTGFFFLRQGINTINVITQNNVDIDFTVKYKRRYFI